MYCTQCGCKIEDGFRFCPKCGASVVDVERQGAPQPSTGYQYCAEGKPKAQISQEEIERIADDIFWANPDAIIRNISKLQKRTKIGAETAKAMMDARLSSEENQNKINEIRASKRAEKEAVSAQGREIRERMDRKKETRKQAKEERKVVHCPKCKSTSISYTGKELSVGRGVVGYGLAGPTGAILGGLSSKKGYAVCLKCGKRWKI